MARTTATVKYIDHTGTSVNVTTGDTTIDATLVTNGLDITNFFDTNEGTRAILVTNAESSAKTVTIKEGTGVNATGDLAVSVPATTQLLIGNLVSSKYDQGDGSLFIDFATGMTGSIIGIGEGAALRA